MPTMPPVFRPAHLPSREERRREDDRRRGSARERGYTAAWDKAAARFRRANPLCAMCEQAGELRAAEVVDHVRPHRGDPDLFWDETNWQALCKSCHDGTKQREERRSERRGTP